MMKYMELVSQKRARERREGQDFSLSDHNLVSCPYDCTTVSVMCVVVQVNEVRSPSQATDR